MSRWRRPVAVIAAVVVAVGTGGPAAAELRPDDPRAGVTQAWHLYDGAGGARVTRAWDRAWRVVAQESQGGSVSESRLVRYGSPERDLWSYKELNGDFWCATSTFGGDPAPGYPKRCEAAARWTTIAAEGQVATVAPSGGKTARWVRYGYGDRWHHRLVAGQVVCSSAAFGGDPHYGVRKICQVEYAYSVGVLADEGDSFTLAASTAVRYGVGNRWVLERLAAGTHRCSPSTFGGRDPLHGTKKHCASASPMGQGAKIAVVGAGTPPHPDLDPNIDSTYALNLGSTQPWPGDDAVSPCGFPPGVASDTEVAGVAAAVAHNGTDIAGVAPFATILPVSVYGCDNRTSPSTVAAAIRYAAGLSPTAGGPSFPTIPQREAAQVVLVTAQLPGSPSCTPELQQAIDQAADRRVAVVVGAGDTASDLDQGARAPLGCDGVIVVGSSDRAGRYAASSSYGSRVVLAAPGVDIPVLGPAAVRTGTAYAAAVVAGVVALIRGEYDDISVNGLEAMLRDHAQPFSSGCLECGAGIVDAEKVAPRP